MSDKLKPRLFIASSIEARAVASAIKDFLEEADAYDVEVWTEGFFQPGSSTYSSIATRIQDFDGGVFVLSPDDGFLSRRGPGWTARPNVVFELGMFAGVLGIGNCLQVRLKVQGHLPHLGSEVYHPRAEVAEISDLAGITWIEADADGLVGKFGRVEFSLDPNGLKSVSTELKARAARDARSLHLLQSATDLVAIWQEGGESHHCAARLVVFGDRVRIRYWWKKGERTYDLSLKYEAEDRLTGRWWDSDDRGYAGQVNFQVRATPQFLLGHWVGWSTNGGVKAGEILIARESDLVQAVDDQKAVLQCRVARRELLDGFRMEHLAHAAGGLDTK